MLDRDGRSGRSDGGKAGGQLGVAELVQPLSGRRGRDQSRHALLRVAAMPQLSRGAVYNVCSGVQSTLAEVVSEARSLLNISAEPEWSSMEQRFWDTDVWVGSKAAMERDTGWRSTVGLHEGLARTIKWFEGHPEWLDFYREKIMR